MDPVHEYVMQNDIWRRGFLRAAEQAKVAGTEGRLPTPENFRRLIEAARESHSYRWRAYCERHHGAERPTASVRYYLDQAVGRVFGFSDPDYPAYAIHPAVNDAWEQAMYSLPHCVGGDEEVRQNLDALERMVKEGKLRIRYKEFVDGAAIKAAQESFQKDIQPALHRAGILGQYFKWYWSGSGNPFWTFVPPKTALPSQQNWKYEPGESFAVMSCRELPAYLAYLENIPEVAEAVAGWRKAGRRVQELASKVGVVPKGASGSAYPYIAFEANGWLYSVGWPDPCYSEVINPRARDHARCFYRVSGSTVESLKRGDFGKGRLLSDEEAVVVLEAWTTAMGLSF